MELINVFDGFLSEDNDVRHQAESFLIDQIDNNPTFYVDLVQLYSELNPSLYKRLDLILIKNIVKRNFAAIQKNFQEFCQLITNLILSTSDIYSLKMLSDIIYHLSHDYAIKSQQKEIWEEYTEYLVLYRSQNDLFPFCIHLLALSMIDKQFYSVYQTFLDEIIPEIIFLGLQHDNIEIKLNSTVIFVKISKKVEANFLDTYQSHYDLICQIAGNSLKMSEDHFYRFWTYLFKIDNQISAPLFEIAYSILTTESLQPNNRNAILRFIIQRSELINPDDIEDIIVCYFRTLFEIEELDDTTFIFKNLTKIDEKSYEIFKILLCEFLSNEDEKLQYIGFSFLPSFFEVFQKASINDISEILPIAFTAASKSEENIKNFLLFLKLFLNNDTINLDDSLTTIDFLINVITDCSDINIQHLAFEVCKSLPKNPVFFEKMIGIYENIQPDSFAFYFSILIHFYRVESCINMDKYEPFLTFLIGIFNESTEKVSELKELYQQNEEEDDDELFEQIYLNTLISCSSGNLIIYFWFFNPIQLNDFLNPAIDNFFNIIKDIDLSESDKKYIFNFHEIKCDFTYIVSIMKEASDEIILSHSEEIYEGCDINKLQHYICTHFDIDDDNYFVDDILGDLDQEINGIIDGSIDKIQSTITILNDYSLPLSKWIHKVSDVDNNYQNHVLFLKFLHMIANPTITRYDIYNKISIVLLRLVKPKRIEYNKQNNLDLAKLYIKNVYKVVKKLANIIENIETVVITRYFDGFSNLVLIFAYLGMDALSIGLDEEICQTIVNEGHEFLMNFLINFYYENQESTEVKMLNTFIKMIDIKFYIDEEIELMIEIVKKIIERQKIYHDIEIPLVELIINLSKIHPEISPSYIELAVGIFNSNKENLSQTDLTACCARFLLSSFNQNPEEFSGVIMPMISDILAVFPINGKHKTEKFWMEMKSFIEICKDSMTKEIYESLIGCLTKYLSYQKFTNVIFSVPREQHGEIIQFYGELIKNYISECPDATFKDILDSLLPHQPTSVEFILSLYSEE